MTYDELEFKAQMNERFDEIERNQRRIAGARKILIVRNIDWKGLPHVLHGRIPEVGMGEDLSDYTRETLSELDKVAGEGIG